MTGEQYTVILVYATSHALRAEKILQEDGISCKLIPVPRHLSSDCGVCVRVARSNRAAALRALEAAGVETVGVHEI
jgi:hypothetical protein